MSGRRQYSDKHSLPDNPEWVEFPRSDGDESQWPQNTTCQVDSEGQVNFMRPVPLDEAGPSLKWRVEIAVALARGLGWAEGPSYVLKSWPSGYRMFDHNKGPQDAPRHDLYLMGSKSRYRSIPEFVPHAMWLFQDSTLDRANCGCKYCSKKAQREITHSMDFLPGTQSPRMSKARDSRGHASSNKGGRARVPYRPYAAVQKMPKPPKLDHAVPKLPIVQERNSDLRATYPSSPAKPVRLFREGELLWCHLDPPIRGSSDASSISFWPGLVQDVKLKCEPVPRMPDGVDMPNGRPINDGDDSPPPWTVRQSTIYKMKLLAVSYSYTVPNEKLLPYQGYAPPSELIHAIQGFPLGQLDFRPETISAFNPCPPLSSDMQEGASGSGIHEPEPMFAAAVAPFTLAVQIAAKLSGFWCLTDEWEFKHMVIPGAAAAAAAAAAAIPRTELPHTSISSVGFKNAAVMNGGSISSGPMSQNVSGSSSNLTPADHQDSGSRVLSTSQYPAQPVTQTRYQGLWWGAERIWTDDLVRVKLARRQLAPEGRPDIYAPAGPSRSTLECHAQRNFASGSVSDCDLGAGSRGVFMKLEGLFIVEVPREDGMGTMVQARASGMLYELADEDWEDPQAEEHEKYAREQLQRRRVGLTSGAVDNPPTPNTGLSQPTLSWPYPLPKAPTGFKFRPILTPGHEAILALSLLSGRYYPQFLRHPLVRPAVLRTCANPIEQGGLHEGDHLWALEGLSPGFSNSVDPRQSKASRLTMVKDADKEARDDIDGACIAAMEQPPKEEDVKYMEVDVINC